MRTMQHIRAASVTAILAGGACILHSMVGCTATGGCRSDDGVQRAECPVCRRNGDLACLCVRIEAATPRCEYGGVVHYFCSEECRVEFLADPERYSAARR